MQRHRHDEHIACEYLPPRPREPPPRRAQHIMPVPMFEPENKPPPHALIEHHRPSPRPGPHPDQTGIALRRLRPRLTLFTGQRNATGVTDQPRNERRLAPARPAQTKVALDPRPTAKAPRRIKGLQNGLDYAPVHVYFRAMTTPPQLTDRQALCRNRARAARAPALFLHETARDEIHDRLAIVNKEFTKPAIVTGMPDFWADVLPDATLVEDAETLALDPGAHDLVIHAMALHWANDPVGQLIQCRRALAPDGLFLGVLFGGETLHELRAALAQAESDIRGGLSARVAPMAEIRDLGALMQRAGYALPVADSVPLTAAYRSARHLMQDLRAMGETNALTSRPRRFARRDVMARAETLYANNFPHGEDRLQATFDLIFLTGWAPDPSQPQPLRPGSATASLAAALGTEETKLKD